MEFPFPPTPPGYTTVLIARGLLVVWAIIGVVILAMRLRQWKLICPHEMHAWVFAAGISWACSGFGTCPYGVYDDNSWLKPALMGALSVSAAGFTIGLAKIYVDGSRSEKWGVAVLMGIIMPILGIVLLPSLVRPREASNRTQCKNNLKQIGLALHNYLDHDQSRSFPPSAGGEEPISWRVVILPYSDQAPLFKQYVRNKTWDDPVNTMIGMYRNDALMCPSVYGSLQDAQKRWFTSYSMPTGPRTIGESEIGTKLSDITDGSSNTLLAVEACGAQIPWTEPRDVNVATQPTGISLKGTKPGNSAGWLSSFHKGGTHIGLADGSVRFLSEKADPAVLKKLATIDGGEQLNFDDF